MTLPTITPCDDGTLARPLTRIRSRIERNSSFRFAWQFFHTTDCQVSTAVEARAVLDALAATSCCHEFLRRAFDDMYDPTFQIQPIHKHAKIVTAQHHFANILASAANDHLGAYSRLPRDGTAAEISRVKALFSAAGHYLAFELISGTEASCELCSNGNSHLFSTWFYGVAWDWCFVLGWPEKNLSWVGCLTDTD